MVLPSHQTENAGASSSLRPVPDDVVVRQRRGNPRVDYVLGTLATPDQFSVSTREQAVARAVAFATKERVRAWFDNGDNTFVLLGTFRDDN
jgi:hypothetical protein